MTDEELQEMIDEVTPLPSPTIYLPRSSHHQHIYPLAIPDWRPYPNLNPNLNHNPNHSLLPLLHLESITIRLLP